MSDMSMALAIVTGQLTCVLIGMIFLHQRFWRRYEPKAAVAPAAMEGCAGASQSCAERLAERLISLKQGNAAMRQRWSERHDLERHEAFVRHVEEHCQASETQLSEAGEKLVQALDDDGGHASLDAAMWETLVEMIETAQRALSEGLEQHWMALIERAAQPDAENTLDGMPPHMEKTLADKTVSNLSQTEIIEPADDPVSVEPEVDRAQEDDDLLAPDPNESLLSSEDVSASAQDSEAPEQSGSLPASEDLDAEHDLEESNAGAAAVQSPAAESQLISNDDIASLIESMNAQAGAPAPAEEEASSPSPSSSPPGEEALSEPEPPAAPSGEESPEDQAPAVESQLLSNDDIASLIEGINAKADAQA